VKYTLVQLPGRQAKILLCRAGVGEVDYHVIATFTDRFAACAARDALNLSPVSHGRVDIREVA
jgi:hypothetical protein